MKWIRKPENQLGLLAVIILLSLGPWFFASFVSLFAFDAPGSDQSLGLWLAVVPLWVYPLVAGACGLGAFLLKRAGRARGAVWILLVPLAWAGIYSLFVAGMLAYDFLASGGYL